MTADHEELSAAPLPAASRAALGLLAEVPQISDFYLAGSAALALHLDHRPVRDLDLMAGTARLLPPERRDLLAALRERTPDVEVETARDGYLFVRLAPAGEAVGVRLHYYPYPLIDPPANVGALAVAGQRDLAAMKLGAIISRASRRDFVDLYLLCQRQPLDELLVAAEDKFGHVRDFGMQALKGLADWAAAEDEPMPRLHRALAWETVVAHFRAEVEILGRRWLGLV
jgi:hypothetical protein